MLYHFSYVDSTVEPTKTFLFQTRRGPKVRTISATFRQNHLDSSPYGGDSSAVQHLLKTNVQAIAASSFYSAAYAAILIDGSVVTWGMDASGGSIAAVQDQLKNVQQIQATSNAFAAIKADGSVVTWGSGSGGDCSAVQDRLSDVKAIQKTTNAFAALRRDGSVVTWGPAQYGGNSDAVQSLLRNVRGIQSTQQAFAALLDDGSVVTWGDCGRSGRAHFQEVRGATCVQATFYSFAAILHDGTVVHGATLTAEAIVAECNSHCTACRTSSPRPMRLQRCAQMAPS